MRNKKQSIDKAKHLLISKALEYRSNMLEYRLRQKEWEEKENENMSDERWERHRKSQVEFSHDKYLEFFYKKEAIDEVLEKLN